MTETLLIIIVGVSIYILLLLRKIFEKLEFRENFENFYLAFDREFVEEAHRTFKRAMNEYEDSQYDWENRRDHKNFNEEAEKIFRRMKEAEFNYKREQERYYDIIDGNNAARNGVVKIRDIIEQHNDKIFDRSRGFFDEMKKIDDEIKEIKGSKTKHD